MLELHDPVLGEWVSQLLRWVHAITAIAWIGSSFYFIHLDLSLRKRTGMPDGVSGEAWQVHGGGFYHLQKYMAAPPALPEHLTWFKWEAYATWISGFFLLVWVYYLSADLYLIDPAVMRLNAWQAAGIGIGAIALSWVVYDQLCKSPLGKHDAALWVVGLLYIMAAAWGFQQVFGGRGAFIHTGAMIATWMAFSVFMLIIPNQKKAVAEMMAGRVPPAHLGLQAKQRSLHNNYLTLPVLFLMLANHYPLAYQSRYAWAIVGLVVVAGAVVRHFYNSRHAGQASPWWTWGVAAAAMALAIWLSAIGAPGRTLAQAAPAPGQDMNVLAARAHEAIQTRCSMCHAAQPVWTGIGVAPKGIRLETPVEIATHAHAIRVHAVLTHAMPPNNITDMTLAERADIAAWLEARARTR